MPFSKMLNLSDVAEHERSDMEQQKIEFKKKFSKLSSMSRKEAKGSTCLYCGRPTTNFCNSHSLPASFIRNIAVNGKCYINNEIVDLPIFEKDKGVNNSGTFHLICKECDNMIFKEYETPENYEKELTDKMLAQIVLKNYLKKISKRKLEIELYKSALTEFVPPGSAKKEIKKGIEHINNINKLDLNEDLRGFKRAKKVIEKNWKDEYYLFYYEQLDYCVPIAFQYQVALINDLEGNIINDVYNNDPKYKIQPLNICVFPLKDKSIVMLFIDKNDRRYRPFYKQFRNETLEAKLAIINYIIFRYSEDVYISKSVDKHVLNDKRLKDVAGTTGIQITDSLSEAKRSLNANSEFSAMYEIPNFLTMKMQTEEDSN